MAKKEIMDLDLLENELKDVLASLDAGEYPEAYEYISSALEDPIDELDLHQFSMDLLHADKPFDLPRNLIELITKMLEVCIAEGNDDAMNDLGAYYYDGDRGFEQSFDKAVDLYKMAAEKGSRQAQENLGYCYYYGRTGTVDYEKAFHYFALGAFDGHLTSLYKIGDMYLNGYYVPKNEVEAFHIFSHCMESMTEAAAPFVAGPVLLRLGKMYLYGLGTEKNVNTALVCYQKAELYLYDMVKDGSIMYKKSLNGAIEGQAKARQILMSELSGKEWLDGKRD